MEIETITLLKILAILITLALGLIGGFIPYCIPFLKQNSKYLGIANAFGGGVLFTVGLTHMLGEGEEKLKEAFPNSNYPLGYIMPVCGFATILMIEKIFTDSHQMMHGTEHNHVQCHTNHDNEKKISKISSEKFELILRCTLNTKKQFICETARAIQIYSPERKRSSHPPPPDKDIIQPLNDQLKLKLHQAAFNNDHKEEHHTSSFEHFSVEEKKCDHESQTSHIGILQIILMAALSLHSILEGISLGLQSTIEGTLSLLIAISAHKWADVLTMGINLKKHHIGTKQAALLIVPLSIFPPLGILVGTLLSKSSPLIEGILLTLSSGTFLYIATTEITVEEFSISKNRIAKLISFLVGIGTVALVLLTE